jgi:hypothetical protein
MGPGQPGYTARVVLNWQSGGFRRPIAIRCMAEDRTGTETPGRTLYQWSVATVVAASVADAASSWSSREANPVLAGPAAQFGVGSVALKSRLVGASLLLPHVAFHHRRGLYKRLAWMNFATSGVLGGLTAHNVGVR